MKHMLLILLLLMLLGGTVLAEGYNSFMDDSKNLGVFDQFAWDGLYAYWLHTPDDGSWAEPSANLYRMIPGGMEAELLLEGREDMYIYDMLNIGEKLLLSVADSQNGQTHPALINFDGSGYKALPGNIGGAVLGDGVIYNSADGGFISVGGTSVSAPVFAGITATLLQNNPQVLLDRTLPEYLYLVAGETRYNEPQYYFNDITVGSNGVYDALKGYDMSTGLGAPIAKQIALN
jgi:hypothetical protein